MMLLLHPLFLGGVTLLKDRWSFHQVLSSTYLFYILWSHEISTGGVSTSPTNTCTWRDRTHLMPPHGKKQAAAADLRQVQAIWVLADHNLTKVQVEGKHSSWLLAVLCNFNGAVEVPKSPSEQDRLLDFWIRKEIFNRLKADAMRAFSALEDDTSLALVDLLLGLHLMPTQGTRRVKGESGWVPPEGWHHSLIFVYLSTCGMPVIQSRTYLVLLGRR